MVEIRPYYGKSTERQIESNLAERTVYLAGIPVKASPLEIYTILNENASVREFYTPMSGKNNNRHFGFAICASREDKHKLLELRTIRNNRFKLLIRVFEYASYQLNAEKHKENRDILRNRTLKCHKMKVLSNLFSGKEAVFLLGDQNCVSQKANHDNSNKIKKHSN